MEYFLLFERTRVSNVDSLFDTEFLRTNVIIGNHCLHAEWKRASYCLRDTICPARKLVEDCLKSIRVGNARSLTVRLILSDTSSLSPFASFVTWHGAFSIFVTSLIEFFLYNSLQSYAAFCFLFTLILWFEYVPSQSYIGNTFFEEKRKSFQPDILNSTISFSSIFIVPTNNLVIDACSRYHCRNDYKYTARSMNYSWFHEATRSNKTKNLIIQLIWSTPNVTTETSITEMNIRAPVTLKNLQ